MLRSEAPAWVGWEIGLTFSVRLWQILKSEKRNDGVWYYRIHYNVRSSLSTVSPTYVSKPEGLGRPHTGSWFAARGQGWNKMWDEWVEQDGLAKFKKELAAMEFTKEGEGGSTREFGGASAAAGGGAKAGGGKKHKGDDANAHANGVTRGAHVRCAAPPGWHAVAGPHARQLLHVAPSRHRQQRVPMS